jgi:hypothetical protein
MGAIGFHTEDAELATPRERVFVIGNRGYVERYFS